ncbi:MULTISPECIES: hypothetical protein [Acinetobacter]|uniref:Uncharacterized protein n=1 Tax=Acinetobacter towneri TaxID=202956 RepID=A0A1E8DYK7_9GAMM|nr:MULTISPECIES: hypothetical protein [Acinetobacter]MCD0187630.1 hypothetical protein [Acinetobacter sp. PW68]MDM1754151.1 hypothetical protein [Acinetobacter towneri]OFE42346.1 hypothetical protein BJN41_08810 [Acinetobacter towneri]
MMIILLWGFIFLLALAVIFLIWLQFKNQADSSNDMRHQQQVEQKVLHLEEHLKKTLEIMQDLAKKMQVQQEALDKTVQKTAQLEMQNAELVSLLAKAVKPNQDF